MVYFHTKTPSPGTYILVGLGMENVGLLKRGCLGWGANPGPLDFIYFLIFNHFTAEPQRLPMENVGIFSGHLEYFRGS
jgi:hypothetical protein